MIGYLRGKLISATLEHTIIEVNGVGYKLFTPASVLGKLPEIGGECLLHTHLHVREDALQLYGFLVDRDLTAFELLIGVSGIGPKVALAVLSIMDFPQLQQAVLQENLQVLTKIPGVGKKTAQRLVLELKDKLSKGGIGGLSSVYTVGATNGAGVGTTPTPLEDALSALEALGYQYQQARTAVEQAASLSAEDASVEVLIKLALKNLAKF